MEKFRDTYSKMNEVSELLKIKERVGSERGPLVCSMVLFI